MRLTDLRKLVLAGCFALAGILTLVATADAQQTSGCSDCEYLVCPEGMAVDCVYNGDGTCSCACVDTCNSTPTCPAPQ